jgi:HTH-type transcriptional regulator / antitoxin HigA
MGASKTTERSTGDRYMELVRRFPLRPIRDREVHQEAKRVLRSLGGERESGAGDYKTVLVSLIADYERHAGQRLDTSKMTAADIVRHLLAEREMSVNALAKALEISQSALSDMLNGKRDWSKAAIVRLADFFGLQRGVFLR